MKHADALKVTFTALVHQMKTDVRFTPWEQERLTEIDVVLDAGNVTTKEQDQLVVSCLKKFCGQSENY
jgi:hypothetical protein